MQDQSQAIDAQDLWEVIFRHKWKLVLFPLAVLCAGAAVILFVPRSYQSESKILLRVGRETVGIDPTVTTGKTVALHQNNRDTDVRSAIDLLQSRGLAELIVDHVGVDYVLRGGPEGSDEPNPVFDALKYPLAKVVELVKSIDKVSPKEQAIIDFGKALSVSAERNSTVIVVKYETDSPEGARHILNDLVATFQEQYQRLHRFAQSRSFFAEQRDLLQKRLNEAQAKLRDAKNRMGLASVEGRRATYEGHMREIELAFYTAEQDLTTAQARIADLRSQLSHLPERQLASKTEVPNAGVDLLREQLYALQMKEMDLKARYSEGHPLVKAVSAQVKEAREVVEGQNAVRHETVDDVNPVYRELTVDLKKQENLAAGYAARLGTLREQKRLVMGDLKQLNRDDVELSELQREAELANGVYVKYSENFEQARIEQALEDQQISSVTVSQAASLQEKPVSPSKLLVGLGAIALSLGGAVTWVATAEKLNTKIRNEGDAQRVLGVPVYASIPKQRASACVPVH